MKANEYNFVDLIRHGREEGILYVIEVYGGLLQSIVEKRLFTWPDRVDSLIKTLEFVSQW